MEHRPQGRAPRQEVLGGRNVLKRRGRLAAAALASSCLVLGVLGTTVGSPAAAKSRHHGHHSAFKQVNLVSDIKGRAKLFDKEVKNPWGIAFGPSTPLWVNNNFNPASDCGDNCVPKPADLLTKITLYKGANGKDKFEKVPLEITASAPTGMVFNGSNSFKINQHNGDGRVPARFMFNETFIGAVTDQGPAPEGRITGWAPRLDPTKLPPVKTTKTRATQALGEFPTGLAMIPATTPRGPRLLVAGTSDGLIHVYNSRFKETTRPGQFRDKRAIAAHLAAYNVMYLKGRVYVAYAPAAEGATGMAVTVFDVSGRMHKRLVTNGKLVDPWGMAIAPKHWGRFGGALLVGNVDDGRINAFNRHNGHFMGTLKNAHGKALVNPGLWGIAFGNGTIGTPRTLIFAAGIGSEVGGFGPDTYTHGLVGLIKPVKHHHS
jgi:uncharacterized protein (TIGR03118 family)